jgi:hypothetical protein
VFVHAYEYSYHNTSNINAYNYFPSSFAGNPPMKDVKINTSVDEQYGYGFIILLGHVVMQP